MQRQGSLSPPPPSPIDGAGTGSAAMPVQSATTTVTAPEPDTVPGATTNPSPAMLYTLLQDLGLTATAQALCAELQRKQQDRGGHAPARPAPLISPSTPPLPPSTDDNPFPMLPLSASEEAVATMTAVREAGAVASVPPPAPPSPPPLPITSAIGTTRAASPAYSLTASNTNVTAATAAAAAAAARRARRASPVADAAISELSTEMQRKLQPYRHDSLCMKAVAGLAACAMEPLQGLAMGVNAGSAGSLSSAGGFSPTPGPTTAASAAPPAATTTTTPSHLVVDLLPPLWHAEMRTACRGAEGGVGGTVTPPSRTGDSFEIATLIARAAWCELRITELVFTQEYQLGHATNSAAVSAAMQVMQDAQCELADLAGQLVAALQALRSACGSIAARHRPVALSASTTTEDATGGAGDSCSSATIAVTIAARLHNSSIEWLRNAECIMAWVLRRHSAFEAPSAAGCASAGGGSGVGGGLAASDAAASAAQQQRQQRKRRCLEQHGSPTEPELPPESVRAFAAVDGLNSSAMSPLVQPLQDVVMGLPFASPPPSFKQCLEAELARTAAAATAKHSNTQAYADVPVPSLFAAARVPAVVRIAMTVQRVKLLQTLMGLLVTNGHDSVLGAFVASPSAVERVRPWWARQSAMLAQFTMQCVRLLGELAVATPTSSSPRPRGLLTRVDAATTTAAFSSAVASLRELLELQARDALSSVSPVRSGGAGAGGVTATVPEESRLSLCVRILNVMQSARETRAAQLDRFVLRTCTASAGAAGPSRAAAAGAAMGSSSPLSAAAAHEAVFSPLSSLGGPTFGSDASPTTSTVWKVRVPTPPSSAMPAPVPSAVAAGGVGGDGGEAEAGSLGHRGSIGSGNISGTSLAYPPPIPSQPPATTTATAAADSLEAARTAAQVLQWKPHFTELLATIATGRWQAPQEVPQEPYPSSRYHRLRLRLKESMRHAQELLRLQPRLPMGARGVTYPPHPTARDGSGDGAVAGLAVPLSVVEQLPYALQLATLQSTPVVQRRVRARLEKARARRAAAAAVAARRSGSGGGEHGTSPANATAPAAAPRPARQGISPPSAAQPLPSDSSRGAVSDACSAPALLAAATALAFRRAGPETASPQHAGTTTGERRTASGSHGGGTTSSTSPEAIRGDSHRRASVAAAGREEEAGAVGAADAASSEVERSPDPRPTEDSHDDADGDAGHESGVSEGSQRSPTSGSPDVGQDNEDDDDAEAPQLERWHLYDEEAMDEVEEEDDDDGAWSPSEGRDEGDDDDNDDDDAEAQEEEDDEDDGSEASSADMDYERTEDAMMEEVECLEVTPDGRLLALLTARGHLTVFRLQARDSARRYDEELLLDTTLPDMPSRTARLQWYESLSSFVHFSPCHRFLLAAVQFAPLELKSNASHATARAPAPGTGAIHVYSLHCAGSAEAGVDEDAEHHGVGDGARGRRGPLTAAAAAAGGSTTSGAGLRLGRLVGCTTERLYSTTQPHRGACLSARWVDPRWWGGGRRSRWANSAAEPLNTTSASAAVLADHLRARSTSSLPCSASTLRGATAETLPASWRVAAAVLLSEYQCISISTDDCIVRWLPASGLVLQRIMTEPVHDIVVSPLMAAFYVASDAGELYMYDAWDERNIADGSSHHADAAADPCGALGAKPPNSTQAQRLILAVTEEGHPRYHRVGRSQPFARVAGDGAAAAAATGSAAGTASGGAAQRSSQLPARRALRRESSDDPETYEQVHSERTSAHFSGPVTPVFQRVIMPASATPGGPLQPQGQQHPSGLGSCGGLPLTSLHRPGVHRGTGAGAAGRTDFDGDDDEDSYDRGDSGDEEEVADRGQQQQQQPGSVMAKGLPRHLRWLLPQQWAAHTPWDAQLGRRLIRNLLRQTHAADCVEDGELVYERDPESNTAAAATALRAPGSTSEPPLLTDSLAGAGRRLARRQRQGQAARAATSGGAVRDEEGNEVNASTVDNGDSSDELDVDVNDDEDEADVAYGFTVGADYDDDDDGARRPLPSRVLHGVAGGSVVVDVTTTAAAAAAAASGARVSVLESAAHPTPARGPLQRAYYPSGACLLYKSVAKALCGAGDLLDRQTHDEMGPGGSTHHLLSMAFSGEPQWTAQRRLWERAAEEAGVLLPSTRQQQQQQQHGQLGHSPSDFPPSSAMLSDDGDHRCSGIQHQSSIACDAQADEEGGANSSGSSSAPPTPWSTAALARVLLWRDDLQSSRHLTNIPQSAWTAWESRVLASTYHADIVAADWPTTSYTEAFPHDGNEAPALRWSATELLAARGYISPRDAWRRCAPSSQRGLAATARNGRFLCIMASVGPYRKLVNPREPLRDVAGFYACVVFDVYAGSVLRVIPVCPTELSGLQGRSMWTSQRHEGDFKAPIYRLPCTVTVVPLPPASTGPSAAHGGGSSLRIRVGSTIDAAAASTRSMRSGGDDPAQRAHYRGGDRCEDGVVPEEREEDGEPTEVVALTIGGLGNAVYVFDAITGRRLVCEEEAARHAGEAAAAAYEAAALVARTRATTATAAAAAAAAATAERDAAGERATDTSAGAAEATRLPGPPPPPPPSMPAAHHLVSPVLPPFIRKPSDVLASVATWGRGTGFDGITDRSSSATSSPDPFMAPAPYDEETAVVDGHHSKHQQHQQREGADASCSSTTAAPAPPSPHAESGAAAPLPWLLQNPHHHAAAAQGSGWSLRGILWWVHEHPQAATLYSHDEGNGNNTHNGTVEEQEVSSRYTSPRGTSEVVPQAARRGNGNGRVASTAPAAAGQRTANATTAASVTASVASSALSFFYHTLLGVSSVTSRRTTQQPSVSLASAAAATLLAAAPAPATHHHHQQQQQRPVTSPVVAHGPVWRQRRRRLLARLQRHYDPGMLWQAYVTLFAASTTSVNALAPLSAVAALVQWALSIDDAATTTAAALLGPSLHRRSPAAAAAAWVWCAQAVAGSGGSTKAGAASRASITAVVPWYEMQLPQYNSAHKTRAALAHSDRHDASAREADDGQGTGTADAVGGHGVFPFAHILQQREDLMLELQALEDTNRLQQQQQPGVSSRMSAARAPVSSGGHGKSLLAAVRVQAMEEGTMPLTAKARSAQQQERSAAAALDGTRPAAPSVRLPALHHQNQPHVDVINCVATWFDANGGFYVCCGSEDGGLYILGGNVTH